MSEERRAKPKLSVVVPPNTATPEELAKALLRPVRQPEIEVKADTSRPPREVGEDTRAD